MSTGNEADGSLAAQAAAWVPPWAREPQPEESAPDQPGESEPAVTEPVAEVEPPAAEPVAEVEPVRATDGSLEQVTGPASEPAELDPDAEPGPAAAFEVADATGPAETGSPDAGPIDRRLVDAGSTGDGPAPSPEVRLDRGETGEPVDGELSAHTDLTSEGGSAAGPVDDLTAGQGRGPDGEFDLVTEDVVVAGGEAGVSGAEPSADERSTADPGQGEGATDGEFAAHAGAAGFGAEPEDRSDLGAAGELAGDRLVAPDAGAEGGGSAASGAAGEVALRDDGAEADVESGVTPEGEAGAGDIVAAGAGAGESSAGGAGGAGTQEGLWAEAESDAAGGAAAPSKTVPAEDLRPALEAILLVVDEPVGEVMLAQVLELPTERIAAELEALAAEYAAHARGFELRRAAGGWRLYTRPDYAAYVERFVLDGQSVRLTQAALETLAVIAYKQPVTRSRISAIRGVNCDGVIRTLVTRGLIEECGTEPETGAHLYRTSVLFLEKLGLDSVEQLPPLAPFLPDNIDEIADAQQS